MTSRTALRERLALHVLDGDDGRLAGLVNDGDLRLVRLPHHSFDRPDGDELAPAEVLHGLAQHLQARPGYLPAPA
ncbi:hypothetical protein [Streptomyces sp. B21-083]|uniref:hypothetical protein n=1 Tax=Streptomyces sp. B21-083 TaxID=3039410 RepID=UPI002FEFA312